MSRNGNWVRWISRFGSNAKASELRSRRRLVPGVLALEDRRLLATFTVTSTADTAPATDPTPGTLRWAVERANRATSPSTIAFNLGGSPTITLAKGQLELTNTKEPITIDGPGADRLIISGNQASRVFQVDSKVTATISGLTISDGSTLDAGGGLYNLGTTDLTGCTVKSNYGGSGGGGLFNFDGTIELTNCLVSGNHTIKLGFFTGAGGGLNNDYGNAVATGCTFFDNDAGYGGGLASSHGTMSLAGCTIQDNGGYYGGAGIASEQSTLSLSDCTVTSNKQTSGQLQTGGGGLVINHGTATISDSTIADNDAYFYGAGLFNEGSASLTDCTISGNSVSFYGGGLCNEGSAILTGCTVDGNASVFGVGGLFNNSQATLVNSTIADNTGGGFYNGGGLVPRSGTAILTDCTVSGNSIKGGITGGGGLYDDKGTVMLTGTIVAGNTQVGGGPSDILGPGAVTGSFNLVGTGGSGGLQDGVAGNIVGSADPGLAPLGEYGGPTQTMALSPGSPAIGAGTAVGGLTTDQRGFPRPSSGVDIGAFQTQPAPLEFEVTTTADGPSSPAGTLDLRQAVDLAVALANVEAEPAVVAFGPDIFDSPQTIALTEGAIDLSNTAAPITIDGPGEGLLTISCPNTNRNFQIDAGVSASITGLTIIGTPTGTSPISYASTGGGILNEGTLDLTDCTISGHSVTSDGGGVYNQGGTMTLIGCTIRDNSVLYNGYDGSQGSGGGLDNSSGGTMVLVDCTVSGNFGAYGGGVDNRNGGTLALVDSTVSDNSAWAYGAGLYNRVGLMTLNDCTVGGNTSPYHAGGLDNRSGTLVLNDCTIGGNSAPSGAGLFNTGTATLTNTIVAENSGGDIAGDVTGSYDLIGTGGSGGLSSSDGNLIGVADPMLAPLGDYGGATETMALLPGSPALGAGTVVDGLTTDQRGLPLDSPSPDIGAFQSQGFTLTPVVGSTPQSAAVGAAFADALTITVTAKDSLEPVAGGVISFYAPTEGASADLSGVTATVGEDGQASVTATADEAAGSYTVTALAWGVASTSFALTNTVQPAFSGLAGPTIVYGTSSVALSGTILASTTAPPGDVAITVDGVTESAAIASDGTFSAVFDPAGLGVAASPYTITYAYSADDGFDGVADSGLVLTITQATPTVQVADAGGLYTGDAFPAMATVAGVRGAASSSLEGVALALTYYAGSTASGTPLAGAPTAVGTYTIEASFPGSADYKPTGATATFAITQTDVTGLAVSWGTSGSAALQLPATPGGLILPAGRKTDLPWLDIDQITLTLGASVPVTASDVTITGAIGADYGPVTVTESGTTVTIKLGGAIDRADRVTISIGGPGIAAFVGELAVLPGDVNDDGVVNSADLALVRDQVVGILPMTIFGDIVGDGTTDMNDYNAVKRRVGTTLPPD